MQKPLSCCLPCSLVVVVVVLLLLLLLTPCLRAFPVLLCCLPVLLLLPMDKLVSITATASTMWAVRAVVTAAVVVDA